MSNIIERIKLALILGIFPIPVTVATMLNLYDPCPNGTSGGIGYIFLGILQIVFILILGIGLSFITGNILLAFLSACGITIGLSFIACLFLS